MNASAVLVVEDDPSLLAMVAEFLELEGYQTETARNGAEALDALTHVQPDLVLLDMRMPVMSGWDLAAALRERGLDLPIVVLTAAQNAEQRAAEVDAQAYLAKPFNLDELLDLVQRFCGERPHHT